MAKRGKLEVTSRYCKPDGGGSHTYCVRCAETGREDRGPGSRTYAAKLLKSLGWTHDRERGGWCAPLSKEQREAVKQYAVEHGDDWKGWLSADWDKAGSAWSGPYHLLHQLRNQRGPAWLATYEVTA